MSSRSSVLNRKPITPYQSPPTKIPFPTSQREGIISVLSPLELDALVNKGIVRGGGGGEMQHWEKEISQLTPEHQRIIEEMVRALRKLEGIEIPVSESEPEPLGSYIPAWQNSLNTRGFSPGTLSLYRHNVESLLASVPLPITDIAIEGYIASRRKRGVSPTALKNDLKAAKSFFAFLHERDIIISDPTAKVRHPKIVRKEKVCPTEDEIAKFLAVLAEAKNPRAKLMMFLFINTGIRFTEMATLTWGKVNLEEREITVLGKGSKWRKIPIAPAVRDFLAGLRGSHGDSELLFPTESKKGVWDNSDANKMIARLCRRAGIKRYSCHQFRHFFATHTLKRGGEGVLKDVQRMLGHASAAVTLDYYFHTTEEEIRKTHEAFAPLSEDKDLIPKENKGGSNHGQTS